MTNGWQSPSSESRRFSIHQESTTFTTANMLQCNMRYWSTLLTRAQDVHDLNTDKILIILRLPICCKLTAENRIKYFISIH
jgi:hypothetical protein